MEISVIAVIQEQLEMIRQNRLEELSENIRICLLYTSYGGTFDGDGHTISGLSINATTAYQGLFGYVKGGEIKDLTVAGSVTTSTTSSAYAAGIVGYGSPVTIENLSLIHIWIWTSSTRI